jgi:hypothetical protein
MRKGPWQEKPCENVDSSFLYIHEISERKENEK